MTLRVTNLFGFGAGGAQRTYEYLGHYINNTIEATHNFTSVDFGDYSPDRTIIIGISATRTAGTNVQLSGTASDHAIGSVSSPDVTRANFDNTNQDIVGFLAGQPTGTSGTVTTKFTDTTNYCVITVYRAIGLSSVTPATSAFNAQVGTSYTLDLNTTANSLVLGAFSVFDTGDTITWSGLTERYEIDNGVTKHSFADARSLAAETPRSVGVVIGASDEAVGLSAAWSFA